MTPSSRRLFSALFFLSGAAGLTYEVCWTRLLRLPMGNTVYSMTVVLTAFMGGLALGSSLAGRWIDRRGNPLRVYALLEAAIGITCLALPWLVLAEEPLFRWVYRSFSTSFVAFHLLKLLACGAVILIPATLMGATLPVLCRSFIDDPRRIGLSLGWLYAVNSLGAAAGSLLAGLVLVPRLGLRGAMAVGVATSLSVAAIAWRARERVADRARERRPRRASTPAPATTLGASRWIVLCGYGLSGLAAMVFQIAWARVLALVVGSSVYAFALLVGAFILGLVLGSSVASRLADRVRLPVLGFAVAEAGIGITALAMIPLFQRFPEWMLRLVPELGRSFGRFQLVEFVLILAVLLLPTACMGACLPFVGRAVARGIEGAGEAVGSAYSSNAVGTILGAFLGGFVLLPGLGMHGAILFGAAINLLVSLALVALFLPRRRGLPVAAAIAVAGGAALAVAPRFDPATFSSGAYLYAVGMRQNVGDRGRLGEYLRHENQILLYREGLTATIAVREGPDGVRALVVNGKVDASDGSDMATQALIGHVPCLLHPGPRDAAVIGLASGVTLGAVAKYPTVRSIDCIEIASEVVPACRLFDHVNGKVLDDPRVHLVIEDGRNHLSLTDRSYDIIASEPSNPWIAGIASLFTREFLLACRDRLRPGGLMCLWTQLYGADIHTVQSVARTFAEVFPNVTLWETIFGADYILVGSKEPLDVPWDALAARMSQPEVAADLARMGIRGPADLLLHHVVSGEPLRRWAAGGEIYRDDTCRLEFEAPRLLYRPSRADDLQILRALRAPGLPGWLRAPASGIPAPDRAAIESARRAQDAFWSGFVQETRSDANGAMRSYLAALELDPHVVRSVPEYIVGASRDAAAQRIAAGDTLGVLEMLGRIVAGAPDLVEPRNDLGTWLEATHRYPEAEEQYGQALERAPRNPQTRLNLAHVLAMQGKRDEAEAEVRQLLAMRPGHVRARLSLGNIYLQRGDAVSAAREYRAAIALEPRHPMGWFLLGNALHAQGSERDAARALETALARDPGLQDARTMLAACYRNLGEVEKAARVSTRGR